MKNCTIICALLLIAVPLSAAPRNNNRNGNNQNRNAQQKNQQLQRQKQQLMSQKWQQSTLDQLENSLDLNAAQQAKVKPMLSGMAQQITLLNNQKISAQAKNARLQQLYGATWTKISALLTPQQIDTIQQNQMADNLADELKLSKEQKEKIRKLLRAQVEDNYQVQADKTMMQSDKMRQLKENDTRTWAQIEDVLKAAQQQKLVELRADDSLENLADAVDLPREQQTQIRPALVELNTRLMKLRANKDIPLEDKSVQIETVGTATWASIRRMLTPEQQTKFDAAQAQKQAAQTPQRAGKGKK